MNGTFLPFLYPCLHTNRGNAPRVLRRWLQPGRLNRTTQCLSSKRNIATVSSTQGGHEDSNFDDTPESELDRLDPPPDSYSITPFNDRASIVLHAGSGGHGCISFVREKYIENGPPNGGDGGTGGSIYIQAKQGETSLHKLARRGIIKAGRGKNGQGKAQGGTRGEDILITVPVGTIVREVWRHDPIAEQEVADMRAKAMGADAVFDDQPGVVDNTRKWRRDRWLLFPGAMPQSFTSADFPPLPRPRRSNIAMAQPPAPIRLDLDTPMETPQLLAAGSMGGLGNPHFVTKSITRPKYGTKGDEGMKLEIQLELKLLADVGLVGLPNAGKSTLLRAITNSRARIGNWAFTTLQPNIGTVVLDNHKGRPLVPTSESDTGLRRTNFTIADIPGLIEDAHLDRGLGLGFLRHIERAGILAFVIDLSAGDAIQALKGLWKEVGQYELLRDREVNAESERRVEEQKELVRYSPLVAAEPSLDLYNPDGSRILPELKLPPISSKPWLVIATKADLPETRENFANLQDYMKQVSEGGMEHPSGKKNAWRKKLYAIPISAKLAQGVERITPVVVDLLEN
jgi:GTP-binding protein